MLSAVLVSDASGRGHRFRGDAGGFNLADLFNRIHSTLISQLMKPLPGKTVEDRIGLGENLAQILTDRDIDYSSVLRLLSDVRPVFNLERLRAGQPYGLRIQDGRLEEFWYEMEPNRVLRAIRDQSGRYSGHIQVTPFTLKKEVVRGEIGDSLFQAVLRSGEKPELADMLASLFEYDVDFNRDIRAGDRFEVLVEKKYLQDDFIAYGNLLAARLTNAGRKIYLIRYSDPGGKTAYYHPDGRAAKKMFLRCPLPFIRVTSGYGFRRHPVLGFSGKHTGVDLAAPPDTRVRATAAGAVLRTGKDAVRGIYLIVRHPNGYASHYYHLKRIGPGISRGVPVKQAQVIGFVGRSGRTTGYHLHYGLQRNGRFINPMALKSPSLEPLEPVYLNRFQRYSSAVFFLLSSYRNGSVPERIQDLLLEAVACPEIPAGQVVVH